MTKRSMVIGFLTVNKDWDPTLGFVFLAAVGGNCLTFFLILKRYSPICASSFEVPIENEIDSKLILGAALFGAVSFNKCLKSIKNIGMGISWNLSRTGLCFDSSFELKFTSNISTKFIYWAYHDNLCARTSINNMKFCSINLMISLIKSNIIKPN